MPDKTRNQLLVNGEITTLLNKDILIRSFNIFSINLLREELAKITWERKFGLTPYWFFIKGGTALGLVFEYYGTPELTPAASDWDTQIVIDPEYNFDLWYEALIKISDVVNRVLVLGNMVITMMPITKHFITEEIPKKALPQNVKDEWGGQINYRQSADRKTAFIYEYFHPFQPGDTGRQGFAHTRLDAWHDSENPASIQNRFFPLETVEFNQQEYRELNLWREAYAAFRVFLIDAKWSGDYIAECDKAWLQVYWKLERVTTENKNDALTYLDVVFKKHLAKNSEVKIVQSTMDEVLKDFSIALLASGQRTLTIDEFYLYRLVVRYKYEKPKPLLGGKRPKDYLAAWTASGNLRGELIDVTVPRRDSFEARHHGALLKSGEWKLLDIPTVVSSKSVVNLPVLDLEYQIAEQVLIVREVLAGVSSSAPKLEKRLIRGYALGRGKDAHHGGREKSRNKLINLLNQQFSSTYKLFSNNAINTLITQVKIDIEAWSSGNAKPKVLDELDKLYGLQCEASAENLLQVKLPEEKLKNLKKFTRLVNNPGAYPDVWSKDNETAKQNNAGCLDFFYIVSIYANIARQLQVLLKGVSLPLQIKPRHTASAREIIKFVSSSYANDGFVFPQVIGRAATYYHLKDLSEIFVGIDDSIHVDTIDVRVINFDKVSSFTTIGKKTVAILDRVGKLLLVAGKITQYKIAIGVDPAIDVLWVVDSGRNQWQAYLRIHLRVPLYLSRQSYQTEYAYGIPVIRLQDHILNLQMEVGAAEFTQSQIAKVELTKLQRALSVREFATKNSDSKIPPLKRQLSNENLVVSSRGL